MLRQSVVLLLLAAIASASYPKFTVLFHDPADYQLEVKCCIAAFNTDHYYKGAYQVNAVYLSSHVRNYVTQETGPEEQDITIAVVALSNWTIIANATYSEVAEPLQLLRIPISYKTDPSETYVFQVIYSGSYMYPAYLNLDVSAGPFNTTSNAFMLGIDYEMP